MVSSLIKYLFVYPRIMFIQIAFYYRNVYLFFSPNGYLCISPSDHSSISSFTVHLSADMSMLLSVYLSISTSAHPSICPFVHSCDCAYFYLSAPSVCLSVRPFFIHPVFISSSIRPSCSSAYWFICSAIHVSPPAIPRLSQSSVLCLMLPALSDSTVYPSTRLFIHLFARLFIFISVLLYMCLSIYSSIIVPCIRSCVRLSKHPYVYPYKLLSNNLFIHKYRVTPFVLVNM